MKLFQRLLCVCLSLTILASLTSCASSSAGNNNTASSGGSKTLRFSLQQPVDSAAHHSAIRIKEYVEAETNGEIMIDIYPAGQLGDWMQTYDELMMGTLDISNTSTPDTYNPQMAAGFLPYLAYNYDELRQVFAADSFLVTAMSDIQAEYDVKFFGYWCDGFCGVASNKEVSNYNTSNSDKGILIRTPGVDAWKFPFDRLGFRTSTIPYNDTYAALQTGVVDGWTGAPPAIHYSGFRDVESYYYAYDAVHESTQLVMSMKTWESLSPQQQEIIQHIMEVESAASIDISEQEDAEYKKMLHESGIEVIELTDEEKRAIAEDVRSHVWAQLEKDYTKEFLDNLRASLS